MRNSSRPAVVGALALAIAAGPTLASAAEAGVAHHPAAAATPVAAAAAPGLLTTASVKAAAALPAAALAPAQAASAAGDRSFFKTGKGVAVLVLLAVATGYTVYSTDKDRVHSPIRN